MQMLYPVIKNVSSISNIKKLRFFVLHFKWFDLLNLKTCIKL